MVTLLERDDDLQVLQDALAQAGDGHGAVVLIEGEAGIGKSSLVRAFVDAPGRPVRVLEGWCDDFLTSRVLGPLRDIARATGGPLADAIERGDVGAVLDELLRVLRDPLRPTVLVVEDLHWADEATLDAVRFLGRRIGSLPAVLVLTYRVHDLGADHPLLGVLGALPSPHVRRIAPTRLSAAAVRILTQGSGLDADRVQELTGGNPFFVSEVLNAGSQTPRNVVDAVLARVRLLPAAARRAVELLSVVPHPLSRADVHALVEDPDALVVAEQRGLLAVDGDRVRFVHELSRRAILDQLPVARQQAHHRAVLDHVLATWGSRLPSELDDDPLGLTAEQVRGVAAPPARTGYRLLDLQRARLAILEHARALGRGDLLAAHGPIVAHEAFVAGAHRQAIEHQDATLEYEDLLGASRLARLLLERSWSLYNLRRFEEAAEAAGRAAALYEECGDRQAHCRVLLTCSRMAYITNRLDDAFAHLESARLLLEGCPPFVGVEFAVNEVSLLHLSDRHTEVLAKAGSALADAHRLGRGDLEAHASNYLGGSRVLLGQVDEGLEDLRTAVRVATEAGWWEAAARAHMNLVEMLVLSHRLADVDAAAQAAIAFDDDHDLPAHRMNTQAQQAIAATLRGDWSVAGRLLDGLDDPALGAGVLEAVVLSAKALLAVRRGDDDAHVLLDAAWDAAGRVGSGLQLVPVACTVVELAWATGRPEDAQEPFARSTTAAAGSVLEAHLRWRAPLLGHRREATAAMLEPEAASAAGDWRAATDAWLAASMPFEAGLELVSTGVVDAMLEGLRLFDELGAVPAARRTRLLLRERGVERVPRGPQGSTRANPAGLTDRQLEVLVLLAEGSTNVEIAERLVVSVRTVDHHVSAVLQRLGATTRHEAVARARERGVL